MKSHSFGSMPVWAEPVVLAAGSLLVCLCVYADAVMISDHVFDGGVTETLQSILLFASVLFFGMAARKSTDARAYLTLVCLVLLALFIRENDAFFDLIWHGFWVVPALPLLGFAAFFGWRNRAAIRHPFSNHMSSRPAAFLVMGAIILLIFSRGFGSGALWRTLMTDGYIWQLKSIIQEGLELLGYIVFGWGCFASYRSGFGQPDLRP